jgi:hypothetical protein
VIEAIGASPVDGVESLFGTLHLAKGSISLIETMIREADKRPALAARAFS